MISNNSKSLCEGKLIRYFDQKMAALQYWWHIIVCVGCERDEMKRMSGCDTNWHHYQLLLNLGLSFMAIFQLNDGCVALHNLRWYRRPSLTNVPKVFKNTFQEPANSIFKPVDGSRGPPPPWWKRQEKQSEQRNKGERGATNRAVWIFEDLVTLERTLTDIIYGLSLWKLLTSVCHAHPAHLKKKIPGILTWLRKGNSWEWCQFVSDGTTAWHSSRQSRGDAKDSWGLPWSTHVFFFFWPLRHCWRYLSHKLSAYISHVPLVFRKKCPFFPKNLTWKARSDKSQ